MTTAEMMNTSTVPAEAALLNEREAAKMLGVTCRFMQERRRTANGPPVIRFSSRCVRYSYTDLLAWAQSQREPKLRRQRRPAS